MLVVEVCPQVDQGENMQSHALSMRLPAATFLICFVAAVASAEDEPWATEKPLMSPMHNFTVTQQRDSDWSTTIHFERLHAPDIRLTEVYAWPALFYISPDDHWMLQVQKSGSGDNISFLFRIDPEGHLWRMEPSLMELAWAVIERSQSLHRPDLYHTGIDFQAWDLQDHLLHITFRGTSMQGNAGINVPLIYDLEKHVMHRTEGSTERSGS